MSVRGVGLFRELRHGDERGPSIDEREALDDVTKYRLLRYLRAAPVLAASGMVAVDHYTGREIGPLNMYTDGTWIWYSDLAFYVDEYNVAVDGEFLHHVMTSGDLDPTAVDLSAVQQALFGE